MAAYSFTATAVMATGVGNALVAGEAIDAGEFIYKDSTDSNKAKLADNSTEAKAAVVGIALNSATAAGQPINYTASGVITVQAAAFTNIGDLLFLSTTPGAAEPHADLTTSDYVTLLGWATGATTFQLSIKATALALTAN